VRAAAALLALAACVRPVATEEVHVAEANWCFGVRLWFDGRTRFGTVCTETRALCQQASSVAADLGAMGGITAVGQCEGRQ
jgi:uncharacterized membrane protein